LYVKDGINIGAVCMNKHCEAFKQLVYFGLVLGSEDGGMGWLIWMKSEDGMFISE